MSTALSLLDAVTGGVRACLPVALSGPSGSGRTVLCLQQVHAVLARGGSAAFLTAEPARLVVRQADAMGFGFDAALRERRLRMLELAPDAPGTVRAHGGEALATSLLEAAPDADLFVIDPLTALTSELLDEREMRATVRGLFEPLASASRAVLLTAELDAVEESPALARALKDACGVYAELDSRDDGSNVLHITKSRTGGCEEQPVAFRVEASGPRREGGAEPPEPDSARETEPAAPPPSPAPSPAQRRILVVEDEAVTRAMLCDWLSERYDVSVATDGFAGVAAVLEGKPDLVTLDLNLPRASGYEILRVLRGAGAQVPVLVVSGHLARASDRIRALVLGASDLMAKPVQRFELERKIEALLNAPPAPEPQIDVQDAEALLGEQGARRVLSEPAFRERLERALRFGGQFGLPSCLVAATAPSADALDTLIEVAERRLRPEDALLPVSKSRALFLLVACPTQQTSPVLTRLRAGVLETGGDPRQLRHRVLEAQLPEDAGWESLFENLMPWPVGSTP
ncbi:MAG: response regulator [Myxococcota bacterium]|nr:response regulator [Myxococcota bacterium]